MSFQCLQCIQPDFKGMHTCKLTAVEGQASLQAQAPARLMTDEQASQISVGPGSRNKGGRPKGFDGTKSKQPSALAQAFKKAGLDWKEDFALAIKGNKRERIKLWLKLLPYMITTSRKTKVARWKGKPSRAAKIALEAMERDLK